MSQTFTSFSEFRQRYPLRPGDAGALLGSGSYGKVLKVEDQVETEWVAIKISEFKGSDARSLRAEVELAQKVPRQANIARYDACYRLETDTGINDFAIMKYYPDGNLADLLRTTRLSLEQIKSLVEGILLGLKHLHQNRIVHRDFKPANILISRDNQGRFIPKIADFGLSKLVREEEIDSSDFDLSDGRGTPSYKAPEQIEGSRVSFNLDLWAFGVILYEIMTGEKPFSVNGRTGTESSLKREIELRIVSVEMPPRLDTVPEPFQGIIRRCLVRDIHQRVRREDELLDLLHGRTQTKLAVPIVAPVAEATDIWIEQQIDLRTDMFVPLPPPIEKHRPKPVPVQEPRVTAPAPKSAPKQPATDQSALPTVAVSESLPQRKPDRQPMLYAMGGVLVVALLGGVWAFSRDSEDDVTTGEKPIAVAGVAANSRKTIPPKVSVEIGKAEKANPKLASLMQQARLAYNNQDYKGCMNQLEKALAIDRGNGQAKKLYRYALDGYRETQRATVAEAAVKSEPISAPAPVSIQPAEPSEAERLAQKQAEYDRLIQEGVAVIGNKKGAINYFSQAKKLAEQYKLGTAKGDEKYTAYFSRGIDLMKSDEFDLAKSWFLVAQSLKNTQEVQTKISQCSN